MNQLSPETVPCRVLCISDTHSGREDILDSTTFDASKSFSPPFPVADILIHAGDLTLTGTEDEFRKALLLLSQFQAELKLVIAGNHDLSLDAEWYARNPAGPQGGAQFGFHHNPSAPQAVHTLLTGDNARQAGVTFLQEGLHEFTLKNGATFRLYASPWQPEFFNWAFNYPHDQDRWNPEEVMRHDQADAYEWSEKTGNTISFLHPDQGSHPIPDDVAIDIVVTHGPPWKHLDECIPDGIRAGCPQLLKAIRRVKPALHVFGHIHEGWGAELIQWGSTPGLEEATEVMASLHGGLGPLDKLVRQDKAVRLDVSVAGGQALRRGDETLAVNAAIVDVDYKPTNAAILVVVDLPKGNMRGQQIP